MINFQRILASGIRYDVQLSACPSNIAEGDELGSNKQAVRFFYIAKGSTAEVLTQSIIALDIGYITKESFEYIEGECRAISSMLTKLIKAREK